MFMFSPGNFNWQGRVGLVRVGLGVELVMVRVRNKVKDIGTGLRSGLVTSVRVTCSLGQNSANIPQFQFQKLGLLSACQMVAI